MGQSPAAGPQQDLTRAFRTGARDRARDRNEEQARRDLDGVEDRAAERIEQPVRRHVPDDQCKDEGHHEAEDDSRDQAIVHCGSHASLLSDCSADYI